MAKTRAAPARARTAERTSPASIDNTKSHIRRGGRSSTASFSCSLNCCFWVASPERFSFLQSQLLLLGGITKNRRSRPERPACRRFTRFALHRGPDPRAYPALTPMCRVQRHLAEAALKSGVPSPAPRATGDLRADRSNGRTSSAQRCQADRQGPC